MDELDDFKQVIHLLSKIFKASPELFKKAKLELFPSEIDDRILVTHSFKLYPDTLELIKDIVHTKKTSGQSGYTQSMALYEAVFLLGSTMKVLKRPQEVKDIELKRSSSIKKTKRKTD
jgi:hypothetical protein